MSACIEFNGARDKDGYGIIRIGKKVRRLSRVMYEDYIGPIPEGMMVLHSCDNPPCINTDHFFVGTGADNVHDMVSKGRHWTANRETFSCGHPISPENTKIRNNQRGWRECRQCFNERMRPTNRAARARKRELVARGAEQRL